MNIVPSANDPEKLSSVPDTKTNESHPSISQSTDNGQHSPIPVATLDWEDAQDPENPQNWPQSKKIFHTLMSSSFAFAVTFGSSVYTPAYAEVAQEFAVSREVALLPLSLYVLGLALGPMIAAPLSETHGRSMVYRVTILLSILFTLGAGFSQSIAALLVCRFLAGAFGSSVLAVGAGTQADMFPPRTRALASVIFLICAFGGSAFGPIIGGFVAEYKGWRWSQWTLLFFYVTFYAASLFTQETYRKSILLKRARKLGVQVEPSLPPGLAGVKMLLLVTLRRPVYMLVMEPIVGLFSLYAAFTFAVLFAFFAAFPLIFGSVYGFSTSQSGLAFVGIAIGVILAAATMIWIDRVIYRRQHEKAVQQGENVVQPEHRLYGAMAGSFGVTIGLFWFAWTARADVHWAVCIVASIPFSWGNLCIFSSSALYLIDVYGPQIGASAMAANGLARYILAAVFPLFTVQMYQRLTIPWAVSLLGFLSLMMLPIPWIIYKRGPQIRARSHLTLPNAQSLPSTQKA